jgi:hypothetical protein
MGAQRRDGLVVLSFSAGQQLQGAPRSFSSSIKLAPFKIASQTALAAAAPMKNHKTREPMFSCLSMQLR